MEQYKNEYEWYLEKINGYCTKESSLYLEQEAERIAKAKGKQSTLLENYYDGKISESEYKKEGSEIKKVLEHQNRFEVIYQQYLYIWENAKNRCFLQTNGWGFLTGARLISFFSFILEITSTQLEWVLIFYWQFVLSVLEYFVGSKG